MAVLTNIVINDGKATPVPRTFSRTTITGNSATLNERSAAAAIGWPSMSLALKEAPGFDGVNRVTLSLRLPVLETVGTSDSGYTAAPKVAWYDAGKVELMLPGRSNGANRKDLRILLLNALNHPVVVDLIENLAPAS